MLAVPGAVAGAQFGETLTDGRAVTQQPLTTCSDDCTAFDVGAAGVSNCGGQFDRSWRNRSRRNLSVGASRVASEPSEERMR